MKKPKLSTNTKSTSTDTRYHLSRNLFDFLYVIGKGGFGKVWRVRYKRTQEIFALKEMSKKKILDKKSEFSINNERVFLSKLRHPFLVNMHYAFQDNDNLFLVIDNLNGGDLRYHCSRYRKFSEEQTRFFIACIVHVLSYIHKNNVIHRDIKPENLIMDDDGYVHLTDFGIAKENCGDNSSETSGTPGYMSPEVILGIGHSFAADYYAIGVIAYEFMLGKRPYSGKSRKEIKEQMFKKQAKIKKNELEKNWSLDSMDFINKLIERKPAARLGSKNGIQELKDHFWLKYYSWKELENKTLPGPFIPDKSKNFDTSYCLIGDKIGDITKLRYEKIALRDDYLIAFANFYYNRDEKEIIIKDKNDDDHKTKLEDLKYDNINIEDNSNKDIINLKQKYQNIKEENNKNKIKNKLSDIFGQKPKTLFCLLKSNFYSKNENSIKGKKIQINYQVNDNDLNKNPKNMSIKNFKERLRKNNSFNSSLLFNNNKINDNYTIDKTISKSFKALLKDSIINYKYASNTNNINLINSPNNSSIFNNIKNRFFNKNKKHYKNSIEFNEKNKNTVELYNGFCSPRINNMSILKDIFYKMNNVKGNKESKMKINKKYNIKFSVGKSKNKKNENNDMNKTTTKKLYRNNSVEFLGYKEFNKNKEKK